MRWKWLLAPVGYAALTFLWMLESWWWHQPTQSGSLNFSLDGDALKWMARESPYQGMVVLIVTALLFSILPRIHLRHAACVSLASVVAVNVAYFVAVFVRRPIATNGEQLVAIVVTYAVVLLVSRALIGRSEVNVA